MWEAMISVRVACMESRTWARRCFTVVRQQVVGVLGEVRYVVAWVAGVDELFVEGGSMEVILRA